MLDNLYLVKNKKKYALYTLKITIYNIHKKLKREETIY